MSSPTTVTQKRSIPRVRGNIVALMVALSAMSYFDRTIMSIAGPTIMKERGISATSMGVVYSAFLLSYAILMSPGGALADRFGPRLVLGLGGLGNALFTGLTALCGRFSSFLVVRLAFGVCTAPLYPATGRLSANWVPAHLAARVQGLIMGGATLGGAISPIMFAALIGRYGWQNSFWIAALITAALYTIWSWYVRDYPAEAVAAETKQKPAAVAWRKLLTDRNLVLLTLSYFCLDYFEYIFFYWTYYYFGEIRHMGKSESATYVSIVMLTTAIMMPLGGWVSDRLGSRYGRKAGRRAVSLVGMSVSAILLYLGAGGLSTFATVTLLSLAFGFCGAAEGPFWSSAIDVGGAEAGAACGIMNTGGNVGGLIAPVLTPFLSERLGWTWGLYFGSIVMVAGLVAWFFIDPAKVIQTAE